MGALSPGAADDEGAALFDAEEDAADAAGLLFGANASDFLLPSFIDFACSALAAGVLENIGLTDAVFDF